MDFRPGIVATLHCLVGLLFVGVGIPLALRRVPPNVLYGFRTPRTLSDPNIWYAANYVTGIDLIIAGFAIILVAIALYILRVTSFPSLRLTLWSFAVFVGALLIVAVDSFWFIYRR
jgi:uncharacterized membrane protein